MEMDSEIVKNLHSGTPYYLLPKSIVNLAIF